VPMAPPMAIMDSCRVPMLRWSSWVSTRSCGVAIMWLQHNCFAGRSSQERKEHMAPMVRMLVVLALLAAGAPRLFAQVSTEPLPAWLFPIDPPPLSDEGIDPREVKELAQSHETFTQAQLTDLFYAPDWYPGTHGAMPKIVGRGRPPDVYACGFCHSPRGQGRPENAPLAGLPVSYIEQQVADFKSGARRRLWTGPYRPTDFMIHVAEFATPNEVRIAAEYFSRQRLLPRVQVLERSRVPRARVVGLVYATLDRGGDEELGERLLEFAPDPKRHEKRDETMRYLAYVPLGALSRGRGLAEGGAAHPRCVACHGPKLQGIGLVPGLAGRSPTYLLRQLLAFKTGARAGAYGGPMKSVAAGLDLCDMIAAAAYAASLPTSSTPN
jgi:cytochrome c553